MQWSGTQNSSCHQKSTNILLKVALNTKPPFIFTKITVKDIDAYFPPLPVLKVYLIPMFILETSLLKFVLNNNLFYLAVYQKILPHLRYLKLIHQFVHYIIIYSIIQSATVLDFIINCSTRSECRGHDITNSIWSIDCSIYILTVYTQNLLMWSPLLSSHLY